MKNLLVSLALVVGLACLPLARISGQCTDQVMHTSGSALVAGVNVTVTSVGNTCNWTTYCPGVTQPFFIGYNPGPGSGPGSFTLTFSPAISACRLNFSGASNTAPSIEEIRLFVNGSHYAMPSAGSANGCDPMATLTVAGDLRGCSGCGVSGWAGTVISAPITTLTVEDVVIGGSPNGSLFSLWICPAILPEEWVTLDATANAQGQVDLDWVTATEVNADYFAVQRSRDGEHWEELDMVSAVGNSDHETAYRYTDRRPLAGLAQYRLRQVSDDGASNFSEVRLVDVRPAGTIGLYPNPSHGRVEVVFPVGVEAASVLVFNALGQLVPAQVELGNGRASLNTALLAPGVYTVQVRSGDQVHRARMVAE